MQLKSQELISQLNSGLGQSYLFHGAEPLLVEDSVEHLRTAATKQGFNERLVFTLESGFDWSVFASEFNSLSLFSSQKLIELRMPTGKPGVKGAEVLADLTARESDDTLLLVICAKLEPATKNSKWVKQFTQQGVAVEHYAISPHHLLSWINQRSKQYNLNLEPDAARLLAYYLEGNLLALDQALRKFSLLTSDQKITVEAVQKAVEDSARFSIYSLVDTALSGQLRRTLRMLNGLKSEGVEPVLINWALARETRQLLEMSSELNSGSSMPAVLKKHRVWSNRSRIVEAALKRLKLSQWQSIHQSLSQMDRMIKGRLSGQMKADLWTEYERIIIALC